MASWIDAQGKLGGKVSIIDLGALVILAIALISILILPGKGSSSIANGGKAQTVEVDIMVRGLSVLKPDQLVKPGDKTSIVIRNQPRGEITVKQVSALIPKIPVPQPDGSVKAIADPRLDELYIRDFAITLSANATVTDDGVIFGGDKVKIGTAVDLETQKFLIRGSVMDVRF
ncbi:MAG: DUF4330 domain-containing protein [Pseudanabaenaceae cyanobacterium bins.68]|nr:DUF4330 domain-containing protein [Pseudanabaenaceae cyanobacterium bins.68]